MNLPLRRITRRDLVIDDYHSTKVADPYRWLEDDAAPEVQQWMNEQHGDFEKYISGFEIRKEFVSRLKDLWHYTKCGAPEYVEGVYYVWRHEGLQNQSVLYRLKDLDDAGEVVLDPNLLSEDGTIAVTNYRFSPKGSYLVYGLSESGSDWENIKVLDLKTGKDLPDVLLHTQFTSLTWLPDESGFIYNRYPDQENEAVLERVAKNSMLCLHILGQDQNTDKLLHKNDDQPDWDFSGYTDEDNKWLFKTTYFSTMPLNQLHYKPMDKLDSPWLTIADNFDEGYNVIGVVEDTAYITTEENAPFGKVMSLKLSESGASDWQTVIAEQERTLEWAAIVYNHIMCCYLEHATHTLALYDLKGNYVKDVELPSAGSVTDISCKQNREEFFIQFTSCLYPTTVFRCDFSGNKPSIWFQPKIDFPLSDYETVQEFYNSKDGTRIPLFLTKSKKAKLDGSNPVLLYGYGGYNVNMTPSFSAANLAWLERGGIYAVACLRGGSEYGEEWHQAGMLEKKQNVFDDFIAAAEYLIKEKYTSKEKLAIMGHSNGGLLTGACLTQRPDLFGAVIVGVPVVDMLRFHLFTAGRYWTEEYGCAENADQFPFMYKYSPLHNVKMNAVYPPTLIMTADTDDRVVPGQARKFAATLQAADAGVNPILIRIEKSAGHGAGKPLSKTINENADLYAFLYANLIK